MPTLTRNGIPFHIQIRESLKAQVAQNLLMPGQKLPPEDELAANYGVSRMKVRQGLSSLIDDGLLYRQHGIGTFVSNSDVERDHRRLTNFFESCRRQGKEASVQLLQFEVIPVGQAVAENLHITTGDMVVRILTLRAINGKPVTLHDAQLPVALFPQLPAANPRELRLESRPVWELIEDYGYGLSHVTEQVEARVADDYLADVLNVGVGSPILYGARVAYATDGKPLKYADCYNRGDKVSLTIDLLR